MCQFSMKTNRLVHLFCSFLVCMSIQLSCPAQVASSAGSVKDAPPPLPLTTQIKKTIVFLSTSCLHDYTPDTVSLKQSLQQLTAQQQFIAVQQLVLLTSRFQRVPQSLARLNEDEVEHLRSNFIPNVGDPPGLVKEILWRVDILLKMSSLSAEDIASLTPESLPLLPVDEHLGTGFFVSLPDERFAAPPVAGKITGFTYLVTNRHVIEPGTEVGRPCQVVARFAILNRKPDSTHSSAYAETSRIDKVLSWGFSDDQSVDLAAAPVGLSPELYDFVVIPTNQFINDDDVKKNVLAEGDPVLFSGLFIQTFNEVHTLEPIVRSGTLAMVPAGLLPTTMNNKPGHIYLAEAHAFGGNSGSPMFIDTNRFANVISGPSYRLLGVISGEVPENANLTLNVTTTLSGSVGENSDVSTVVPAGEVLKILKSAKFQKIRDDAFAK